MPGESSTAFSSRRAPVHLSTIRVFPVCGTAATMEHSFPAHFLTNIHVGGGGDSEGLTRTKWILPVPEECVFMLGEMLQADVTTQAHCLVLLKYTSLARTKLQTIAIYFITSVRAGSVSVLGVHHGSPAERLCQQERSSQLIRSLVTVCNMAD